MLLIICLFFLLFSVLSLKSENIFVLQEKDSSIYNQNWVLDRLNNRKINYQQGQEKITLIITSENEYASGSAGCNTYVGQVIVKRNYILFRDIGTTKMACPEQSLQTERIYLNNLNDIDSWAIIDEDLYLYKNGRPVLIFSKE